MINEPQKLFWLYSQCVFGQPTLFIIRRKFACDFASQISRKISKQWGGEGVSGRGGDVVGGWKAMVRDEGGLAMDYQRTINAAASARFYSSPFLHPHPAPPKPPNPSASVFPWTNDNPTSSLSRRMGNARCTFNLQMQIAFHFNINCSKQRQ